MRPGMRIRKHASISTSTRVPVRRKAKVELSVEQIDKEPVQFEVVATSEDVLPADYLEEVADEEEVTELSLEHDETVYEVLEMEYPCEMCDESFATRVQRNQHIENHFKTFECEECHKTFIGDRQFNYHQVTGRCVVPAEQQKSVSPEPKETSEPSLTEWGCYICGKKNFQSRRSLKLHINKLHSNKPKVVKGEHVCQVCEKTFANQHVLKNHVHEIHTNAQEHKCDDCGKQFNRLANLRHHQLIHRNEMPCKCPVCDKAFRTSTGVRLHLRIHTGDRPYKCDICNEKAYAYNTDLVRHKRSAHGIYGKVFQCSYCTSFYYERKHLRKHVARTHGIEGDEIKQEKEN